MARPFFSVFLLLFFCCCLFIICGITNLKCATSRQLLFTGHKQSYSVILLGCLLYMVGRLKLLDIASEF